MNMKEKGDSMLEAVTTAISTVVSWIGTVVTSLVSDSGAMHDLLPLFAIGIAISGVMLGVKVIKSIVWGA